MKNNILSQIKKANLVGRGGAAFPTAIKWELAKGSKGKTKYVICNGSEGELGLFKDEYILKHHLDKVFEGMRLAMDFIGTKEGYFNLNLEYYKKIKTNLEKLIRSYKRKGYTFHVYKEEPSYIGGEATALMNAIEGKRTEPRIKPPYSEEKGLFGQPTLIHNVETLFNVADVASKTFEDKRFCCISGSTKKPGVYHVPADWSIEKILKETGHMPKFDFFVQVGGSVSGPVFNKKQLRKEKLTGAGSIEIYRSTMKPKTLLMKWFKFFHEESCGKCTPCREGTYQLYKLIKENKTIPYKKIHEILETLELTSFCGLGRAVPLPVRTYFKNILKK